MAQSGQHRRDRASHLLAETTGRIVHCEYDDDGLREPAAKRKAFPLLQDYVTLEGRYVTSHSI